MKRKTEKEQTDLIPLIQILYRNATEYTYNHLHRDAVEIILHFINKRMTEISLQTWWKQARALVAYLREEMWHTQAFELCYIEARRPITDIMEIKELWYEQRTPEKRCGGYQPLNYLTMRLEGLFIVEKQCRIRNFQNPNRRRWSTKTVGLVWVNWWFNFPGT